MDNNDLKELLEVKFDGLEKLIEMKFSQNNKDHERIECQVKRTNGRVSSLEKWKYGLSGSIAVILGILGYMGLQLKVIW